MDILFLVHMCEYADYVVIYYSIWKNLCHLGHSICNNIIIQRRIPCLYTVQIPLSANVALNKSHIHRRLNPKYVLCQKKIGRTTPLELPKLCSEGVLGNIPLGIIFQYMYMKVV